MNVGATFSGTLSVPASELNVNWTVEVNGTPVAAITGASGYGTVQITTSDVLVITASNATPGEQYQAVLRGVLHFAGAPSLIPTPTTVAVNQVAAAPPGQIATFPATGSGSAFSESTGTIADNVRTLIVQDKVTGVPFAPGFLPNLEVTGDDSGLIYWDQPFYLANTGGAILTANVRINPAIDSSYTVAIAAVAGDTHTVTISGDSEAFDDSVFYNGTVQEVHTAVVATSQTLVAGPVRILAAAVAVANAAATAILIIDGATALRVDASSSETNTATLSFPPKVIVPAATVVQYTITGGGHVSLTYAYP